MALDSPLEVSEAVSEDDMEESVTVELVLALSLALLEVLLSVLGRLPPQKSVAKASVAMREARLVLVLSPEERDEAKWKRW